MKTEKIHIPGVGWYTVRVSDAADLDEEVERVLRADKSLDKETVDWVIESRKKLRGE